MVFRNGNQQVNQQNSHQFQTQAIPVSTNYHKLDKRNFAKPVSPFVTIIDYLSKIRFSKKLQSDGLFSPSLTGHSNGFDATC